MKNAKKKARTPRQKARITLSLDLDLMEMLENLRARERPIPSLTRTVTDVLRKALGLPERKRKGEK